MGDLDYVEKFVSKCHTRAQVVRHTSAIGNVNDTFRNSMENNTHIKYTKVID